jgi:MrfA Zn-binding domain
MSLIPHRRRRTQRQWARVDLDHAMRNAHAVGDEYDELTVDEEALDCGYPASSLKERVYALSAGAPGDAQSRFGILIYTATAGAQGTLGGLVGMVPRFATILRGALERAAICSNDPVCADHEPDDRSGDRATHGAACHGCLLIAETSCEMRNLFLDRNLLVPTMAMDGSSFFDLATR